MRRWTTLIAVLFVLASAVPVLAQDIDAIKVDPAHHQVVFENEQVRVVHWIIRPGDKTLNHSHPDSLNINFTDYTGKVTTPQGSSAVHAKAGTVSWRPALIHVVENVGSQPMEGFIVEPKKPASARPAGSPDPVAVDPKHHEVLFENEMIRVIRERRTPGTFALHGHPDNVQVLLANARIMLATPGGTPQEFNGKAGEVRWRGATQHSGEVAAGMPLDQILVEMKGAPKEQKGTGGMR